MPRLPRAVRLLQGALMAASNLGPTATPTPASRLPDSSVAEAFLASTVGGERVHRRCREAPPRALPLARGRRGAPAHRRRRRGHLRGARRRSPTTTPTCPASTSRCAPSSTATSCAAATRSAGRPSAAASRSPSSATSADSSRRGRPRELRGRRHPRRDEPAGHVHLDARRARRQAHRRHRRRLGHHPADGARPHGARRGPRPPNSSSSTRTARRST